MGQYIKITPPMTAERLSEVEEAFDMASVELRALGSMKGLQAEFNQAADDVLHEVKILQATNARLVEETHNWSVAEKKAKVAYQHELAQLTAKYEGKLNALRDKLATILAMADRSMPKLVNIEAIRRILDEPATTKPTAREIMQLEKGGRYEA